VIHVSGSAFAGRIALVTGAARGIGRTIAQAFAEHGATVAIADINELGSREVKTDIERAGGKADVFPVDLSRTGAGPGVVNAVVERLGRLDLLVNNARGGQRGRMDRETEENWDLTVTVCCKAPFLASQEAISVMERTGGGAIVNIVSISAKCVTRESASYHASKAALEHLTRYLAVTAGPSNVRVNAVAPGFIVQDEHLERYNREDNISYREQAVCCHPIGRVGASQDVADAALYLCSDAARFVTGVTLVVDGGFGLRDAWNLLSANTASEETP